MLTLVGLLEFQCVLELMLYHLPCIVDLLQLGGPAQIVTMHYSIDLIHIDVVICSPADCRAGVVYWYSSTCCVHVDMEVLHVVWC